MLTIFAGGPLNEFYSVTLPRGTYIHTESTGNTIEYRVYFDDGQMQILAHPSMAVGRASKLIGYATLARFDGDPLSLVDEALEDLNAKVPEGAQHCVLMKHDQPEHRCIQFVMKWLMFKASQNFYITFNQRYSIEGHPKLGSGFNFHNGVVRISSTDREDAFTAVTLALQNDWSNLYTEDQYERVKESYPAGVLGELFDMMDRAERDA